MQIQEEPETDQADGQPLGSSNAEMVISALQLLQLPSASMFSLADIQSTGWEERPRITDCLLTLKRYHESEQCSQKVTSSPFASRPFQSPAHMTPAADMTSRFTPLQLGTAASRPGHAATPDFDLITQQYVSGSNGALKKVAGVGKDATAGVARMMQQCTAMLRERMWNGDGKSSPARPALTMGGDMNPMEAMGPVLESVLGSLTQVSCVNSVAATIRSPAGTYGS